LAHLEQFRIFADDGKVTGNEAGGGKEREDRERKFHVESWLKESGRDKLHRRVGYCLTCLLVRGSFIYIQR
jgi:hypothetical protein